jgi:uncharacterized membrane protein
MNILVFILRLIHILSGVFWVGTAFFAGLFLEPAVRDTGEAGQKMMGHMIAKGRMSTRVTVAAALTVLAGATLYWIDSHGFTSPWTGSGPGWGFGIGGLLGIAGFLIGSQVGMNAAKLGRIAAAAQGKPTPEQIGEMQVAQKRMALASRVSSIVLLLALVCMATARYWGV